MDELLIALVVWLGKSIAKTARFLGDRMAGRNRERADGPHASGAQRRTQRALAPGARDEQAALAEWLGHLRDRLAQDGTQLESDPNLAALGRVLTGALRDRVDQALRLLAGRSPEEIGRGGGSPRARAERLQRAAAEAAWLERAHGEILQMAAERTGARGEALAGADRLAAGLAAELFEPLGWPPPQVAVPGRPAVPTPVTRRGAEGPVDEEMVALGLVVLPLSPAADRRPAAWAALARGLGRHLLAMAPGLRQELHARLGLPRRYPVPYLADGTWGDGQTRSPFGCWLETLFSDVISVCLLGPAGAEALTRSLARPDAPAQTVTVGISAGWTEYTAEPPVYLRVLAAITTQEALGFAETAEALLDEWWTAHGRATALVVPTRMQGWVRAPMAPFEQQAIDLTSQLLSTGFAGLGDTPLLERTSLGFGQPEAAAAEAIAATLAGSAHLPQGASPRPRIRLAAAMLAARRSPERGLDIARWIAKHGAEPGLTMDAYTRRDGRDRRPAETKAPEDWLKRPSAALFRDALVLHELLEPPLAISRHTRRS